ncbi:MAG: GntR family transcriptional regulator [Halanaerobiales bacterium]|nr:GntR family transcriptional regulator [Halanaerobiales bacterium]
MQVNFDISKPIYQQVIVEIQRSLVRGELEPGSKLPSQRDLAKELKVNHNTIQRAYREMEGDGLVETVRGMGTFITKNSEIVDQIRVKMAEESIAYFINEMRSLGMDGEQIIKSVMERVQNQYQRGETV